MALIVEDGTGKLDAESYASVSAADKFHEKQGNAAWADADDDVKEQALRKAARFMRVAYRASWTGRRSTPSQALDWPRCGVVVDGFQLASTVVPLDVQQACMDLALRAAGGEELLPDQEAGNSMVKREKIGPLDTEYFENSVGAAERFPAVTGLLQPYFGATGGSAMMKVVRA